MGPGGLGRDRRVSRVKMGFGGSGGLGIPGRPHLHGQPGTAVAALPWPVLGCRGNLSKGLGQPGARTSHGGYWHPDPHSSTQRDPDSQAPLSQYAKRDPKCFPRDPGTSANPPQGTQASCPSLQPHLMGPKCIPQETRVSCPPPKRDPAVPLSDPAILLPHAPGARRCPVPSHP